MKKRVAKKIARTVFDYCLSISNRQAYTVPQMAKSMKILKVPVRDREWIKNIEKERSLIKNLLEK